MTPIETLKHKLTTLNDEHRALDEDIVRRMEQPLYDQLAVQRLKKKKLQLKDTILMLKMKLIPDIIA